MTDPKVSKKDMQEYLSADIAVCEDCPFGMRFSDKEFEENCEKAERCKALQVRDAIRAALEERVRLGEKMGELKNRAQGILSNPDLMDEPDIFEFIKDVRDFGEEAADD